MCGIGGILRTDGEPIPDEWLDAIDARIAYRGPDGQGRFRDRVEIDTPDGKRIVEVAFVHRRLSIIDHEDGAQPMVSKRGRNENEGLVAVVFNGCIYNHRELRKELEEKGHHFVTDHSDTEVLIHGWREWRGKLIDHLEGMYAFAVWDREAASLYLSRDPFGEKPLYVRETQTLRKDDSYEAPVVAFASEASSLWVMPAPNPVCGDSCRMQWLLPHLMFGYESLFFPGPDLIEIDPVSPGYGWRRRAAQPTSEIETNYVDLRDRPASDDSLEELLDKAVASRLEADVPLGCFLSGGVDSSLIAHFAMQHKPDLLTFSVYMPDKRYDESEHAEVVAKHLGSNHTTLEVSPNPSEDLVHLIDILGQPFGDSSILPTYWVSKAAGVHVKVALSGDGGDELFIGYERYLAAGLLARHHKLLSRIPSAILRKAHPKSKISKFARLGDMARDYPVLGLAAMEAIFTIEQLEELNPQLVAARWKCSGDERHTMVEALGRSPKISREDEKPIECLRDFDLEFYLPGDLLRKVDTASMACALEVRCPFLDRDLANAVLAMPIEKLIPGGKRKGLLRQIARKYLPAEIVDRPKMGFAIPIGEWFRSDYGGMKVLLLDHLQSADPFGPIDLNRKAVQRFIDEHMTGKRDHSQRLFTLLTLSIWAKSL